MSYKALYRTYRPASFEDVVGQKHIVITLRNAVKQNKIAHAYLFCGPRGTGKTSVAKLLAKAVNCIDEENIPCNQCPNCLAIQQGNHPDIVEIDAASNNGVDEIRDLIEKVKYSPIEGKYKVYIIDEVHMMSSGAFNALLKTLEEPPAHVIFILATTEPQKVLPTIISRCQRYDFTKVSKEEIISRVKQVLAAEDIRCEEEALRLIAQLADGGMRDALSIMDQCIAYAQNDITAIHVNEIYGITTITEKIEMLDWIFQLQASELLNKVRLLNEKGIDIKRLTADLMEILKECVIYIYTQDATLLNKINEQEANQVVHGRSSRDLLALIDILMETTEKYRYANNAASYLEVAMLKMMAELKEPVTTRISSSPNYETPKKEQFVSEVITSPVNQKPIDPVLSIKKEEPIVENKQVFETQDIPEEPIMLENQHNIIQTLNQEEEISALDDEFIVQLMAMANKEYREKDQKAWEGIATKCRDFNCAKIANLLKNGEVRASGENFLLITVSYQALANQINDPFVKSEITQFCQEQLNFTKHIFAITKEQFKIDSEQFMDRYKANDLPLPAELPALQVATEIEVEEENQKLPILDHLFKLFGKENIEIIEEEDKP